MNRQATRRYLLMDSSKFGRHATFRVGHLKDMSHILTDDGLPPEWAERLTQGSISFTCVPSERSGT
ncbi:DeoR/GlpR transcriptional regulator [Gluconobacter sp. R75690]|nr:DeoR/GlpR transcriptional regulator [Gluconobacter sp. R75690]MBF0880986.1 DeoR/GlpR transcriptional regulator [Gluconobacter sp. R75828]